MRVIKIFYLTFLAFSYTLLENSAFLIQPFIFTNIKNVSEVFAFYNFLFNINSTFSNMDFITLLLYLFFSIYQIERKTN